MRKYAPLAVQQSVTFLSEKKSSLGWWRWWSAAESVDGANYDYYAKYYHCNGPNVYCLRAYASLLSKHYEAPKHYYCAYSQAHNCAAVGKPETLLFHPSTFVSARNMGSCFQACSAVDTD